MALNSYLHIRVLECVLGIVCFGLFTCYGLLFPVDLNRSHLNLNKYEIRLKIGIGYVAAYAFFFIVQIPYLIAGFKYGIKFNHNILNPMMAIAGCIVYLTAGAMNIQCTDDFNSRSPIYLREFDNFSEMLTQWYAVGSMFVITGCIYMIDLIFWYMKLRNGGNDVISTTFELRI